MKDPVIEELHAIKDQLSKEANYSVDELFRQMREESRRSDRRHVSLLDINKQPPVVQQAGTDE